MISQLGYLFNRCFKKNKLDFLVLRSYDEFDIKLAQTLKYHTLWFYDLSKNEKWNYKDYIPKENMIFVNCLDHLNNIDCIITPHHEYALDSIKHINYIPTISLYHEIPKKEITKLEETYNQLSLTNDIKISNYWELPKDKSKIIPNWESKILSNIIEEFCENSFN